ncbi:MAG: YebC/PmpR family DNA-binding transcriptional regulator [Anaerolineae bacterium]|nr:YebC/PmpR family DNA-binding transcriptional regulator [Anaerolineae bacterium]
MSGHSKWATIKRKKGAADAKRGTLFTKLAREIQLAAREGADPNANFKLRLAVDKARASNMPKENIERAISRGAGLEKGEELLETTYEGYGPHGVAYLVQVVTDNRNRAVSDIRRILTRAGGSMAESGAVAWQFEPKGYIAVALNDHSAEEIFDWAIEAGADDVDIGEEQAEIYTAPDHLRWVREALEARGLTVESAERYMAPKTTLTLDSKDALQNMNVMEQLEELDDVTRVYTNLDFSEEDLAQYQEAA